MRSWFLATCFLTAALVGGGCAADDLALDDEATDPEGQALRRGAFSFTDPAVGRLVVGGAGCTATLINPQVLVTAAHCVGYRTGAATGTFTINLSSTSSRTYGVSEVKSYGSGVGNDDVAIVRLTGAVPASVAVPLEISCAAVISNHERVTMYGYGCRSTQGDSYAGRKQRYDTDFDQTIYACPGDSGGPLIKTLGNRRVISKVFSGQVQHLFLFDWKAAYGLVYKYATSIAVQADAWAGRPPVRPPVCSGGGGGGSDDPPRHMN